MGQTRVDLRHLLEDLRDAYPGSVEETILTEVIANSLDSGANVIELDADPAAGTLTIVDHGAGMSRRELARYHDLATSTKTRGQGIGFAGVGVKLGLLVCREVVTESRTATSHVATAWSLTGRHKAPWHWLSVPPLGLRDGGTGIRLQLGNALSPLLDRGFLETVIRRHYESLLDPRLAPILRPLYEHVVRFKVNGQVLDDEPAVGSESAELSVRLPRKRKAAAVGWLVRSPEPLPEDRRGLAVSTYGKVIKRGWDWLGITPTQPEHIGGLIEVPALAACLTLNKGDFIRSGPRGAIFLTYRRVLQEAVMHQLADWGESRDGDERAQRRAARPVERDLEKVLIHLADDFPMLASLVERRLGGQRKLPMQASGGAGETLGLTAGTTPAGEDGPEPEVPSPPEPEPPDGKVAEPRSPPQADVPGAAPPGAKRPARYALVIHYESRPDDSALARLVETVVWVNDAHPAYARAVASRSEGYHLALCVAMSLAPLVTDPGGYPGFITEFLRRWGQAVRNSSTIRARRR